MSPVSCQSSPELKPTIQGPSLTLDEELGIVGNRRGYYGLNISPPKFRCWKGITHITVLRGRVFGRGLGYDSGAFMNEICALKKDLMEEFIPLDFLSSSTWGHSDPLSLWWSLYDEASVEATTFTANHTYRQEPWSWTFQAPELWEIKFLGARHKDQQDSACLPGKCKVLSLILSTKKKKKIKLNFYSL